ncbi:hypothetical protein [Streptomyces sp. G-5]|uniref:hypothetical protein n=1 Tax=unclassified Streptomyces TaxID=2593676 RepID=UPI003977A368
MTRSVSFRRRTPSSPASSAPRRGRPPVTERDQERGDGRDPIDEEAAWAQIVAGYGEEPADPPGVWPKGDELDLTDTVDRVPPAEPDRESGAEAGGAGGTGASGGTGTAGAEAGGTGAAGAESGKEGGGTVSGTGTGAWSGSGPRDWGPGEDPDGDHFVPPDPPPLPETDLTTKLAWVAVLGGPLLLLGSVLFQQEMTWWIVTLGVGGFLGGFATLISRMRDGDDEWTDPGSGAVV